MRPKTTRYLVVFALLAFTACLRSESTENRPAPPFDLPDLAGGRFNSSALKGKVVVLDFWATWCGPCLSEIPEYSEFWRKNRTRGVEVVGVVLDWDDAQEIADFIREHRIPYRQVLGNAEIQDAYRVNQGLPTTFVVDRGGIIRHRILGSPPAKFKKLQQSVDRFLSEAAS